MTGRSEWRLGFDFAHSFKSEAPERDRPKSVTSAPGFISEMFRLPLAHILPRTRRRNGPSDPPIERGVWDVETRDSWEGTKPQRLGSVEGGITKPERQVATATKAAARPSGRQAGYPQPPSGATLNTGSRSEIPCHRLRSPQDGWRQTSTVHRNGLSPCNSTFRRIAAALTQPAGPPPQRYLFGHLRTRREPVARPTPNCARPRRPCGHWSWPRCASLRHRGPFPFPPRRRPKSGRRP